MFSRGDYEINDEKHTDFAMDYIVKESPDFVFLYLCFPDGAGHDFGWMSEEYMDDDKYYIGFFDNNILVAYMDLILGFPTQEVAFIGLLMTNALYQNRGVGSGIVRDVCTYLRELGYKKVRIGVDKENPQSNSFWYKNGFRIISEKEYNVMELVI